MFIRLLNSIRRFMYGRYGFDRLTKYLLIAYFAVWVTGNIVIRLFPLRTVYIVFNIVMLLLMGYALFRTLSKNIPARRRESEAFERFLSKLGVKGRKSGQGGHYNGYGGNYYNTYNDPYGSNNSNCYAEYPPAGSAETKQKKAKRPKKPKNTKEYKYAVCPNCKTVLRLKRRKGSHIAECPKCGHDVKVFSIY